MPSLTLPDFGARLKRLRRLRGLKQQVVAEIAQVCQTTVSRWEHGIGAPEPDVAERVLSCLTQSRSFDADSILRQLVQGAVASVHLIHDLDHRLLASSIAREEEWRRSASELAGCSLWRFASDAILEAEHRLAAEGWWQETAAHPMMIALEYADKGLRITPGLMRWERLHLADGTPVRLCATA